jgi:hypothetical protein
MSDNSHAVRSSRIDSHNEHVAVEDTGALGANIHDDIAANSGAKGTFEQTNTFQVDPDATGAIGANGRNGEIMAAITELSSANDVKAHNQNAAREGLHGDSLERGQIEDLSMMEKAKMPRATWETIQGQHDAHSRRREKALEVDKAGYTESRAENCRQEAADMCGINHERDEETVQKAHQETPLWDGLTQQQVAEINQYAAVINERLPDDVLTRAKVAELLVHKYVNNPKSISHYAEQLPGIIKGQHGVAQSLEDIEIFEQDRCTVTKLKVKALFQPNKDNQQQVGYLTNGRTDAKLTVWCKSGKKTLLSEGDVITLKNVAVSARKTKASPESDKQSKWIPNLAVTSDTEIIVESEGDGRSPNNYDYPSHSPDRLAIPNTQDSHMGQIHENRRIKSNNGH